MNSNLIIVDDFLPNPQDVRERFKALEFYDMRGPDGEFYKHINVRNPMEFNDLLAKAVGRPVNQSMSLARINYAKENPNNAIHSDNTFDTYAAVLYLSKPEDCRGGTAFWRHKKYGYEHLPTELDIRKSGRSPRRVWDEVSKSWNDETAWTQTQVAEMKFGRCIIYPSNRFHSRWPFSAFGTTPEDGRLIWVSFFSLA